MEIIVVFDKNKNINNIKTTGFTLDKDSIKMLKRTITYSSTYVTIEQIDKTGLFGILRIEPSRHKLKIVKEFM